MSEVNLELSGSVRSTNPVNVDWYYGGGDAAWQTLQDALNGVPVGVRGGKTIGILNAQGEVVEYWWKSLSEVSNADLELKTAIADDVIYKGIGIPDNLSTTNSFGEISLGEIASNVKNITFEDLFTGYLFETKSAYIAQQYSFEVSNFDNTIVEVGTLFNPVGTVLVVNRGQLNNGDDTIAGPLVGKLRTFQISYFAVGGSLFSTTILPSSESYIVPITTDQNLQLGDNTWTIRLGLGSNNIPYTNSRGDSEYIDEIGNEYQGGINQVNTPEVLLIKSARNYLYTFFGDKDDHPTDSATIRALSRQFLDENNEIYVEKIVPARTEEIVFYAPAGKNVIGYNNETGELFKFVEKVVIVNNASGNNGGYSKYTYDLFVGFPDPFQLNLTIN